MMLRQRRAQSRLSARLGCDGGLNMFDEPDAIAANQSSDMCNMWFDGGALRVRPGLSHVIDQPYGGVVEIYPKGGEKALLMRVIQNGKVKETYGIYVVTRTAVLIFDGAAFTPIPVSVSWNGDAPVYGYGDYNFEGCAVLPAVEAAEQDAGPLRVTGKTVYLFGGGSFFAVGPRIIMNPAGNPSAVLMAWSGEPYTPLLFEDCPAAGGGTAVEARNLLTPKASQWFTTDAMSKVYRLNVQGLDDAEVTADYDTIVGGVLKFAFAQGEVSAVEANITATLDRAAGTIAFSTALTDAGAVKFKNNLRVTYAKTVTSSPPMGRCSVGAWFGDIRSKNGGNRIFLTGDEQNPDRVYYSAPDNPWYFPADGYVSVGDPDDAVTALGAHYDVLAVFKTGSLYALDFELSGGISVRLINSHYGCDMPESVRLIENRLVWAHSKKGVLILASTGIRNERSVGLLSRNVNRLFLNFAGPGGAVAVDDGKRYILFCWDRVFLWDYAASPAVSGNLTKTVQDAAWAEWDLPFSVHEAYLQDGTLFICDINGIFYQFDSTSAADDGKWFDAWWYSRAEDFGKPDDWKNHCRAEAQLENAGPAGFRFCCRLDGRENSRRAEVFPNQDVDVLRREFVPGTERFRKAVAGVRRLPQNCSSFGVKSLQLECKGMTAG